jgi:hypothetical protein
MVQLVHSTLDSGWSSRARFSFYSLPSFSRSTFLFLRPLKRPVAWVAIGFILICITILIVGKLSDEFPLQISPSLILRYLDTPGGWTVLTTYSGRRITSPSQSDNRCPRTFDQHQVAPQPRKQGAMAAGRQDLRQVLQHRPPFYRRTQRYGACSG